MRKSRCKHFCYALACCLVSFLSASVSGQSSGISLNLSRYPNITSVNQVIENWDADQHLYVKGELGIGPKQYERLEQWLDENGPHWTIVLMRNANGESYRSLDGRNFQGMDAVEYALGRGLALRTEFSTLTDSRTSETDGAVFVMFLDERKFSYYASVAQDVRRLGESHWIGELDRPAFRAMRGGGRILDAVRDTVTNINSRLTKKIGAELEQAEREALARKRAVVNLRADIDALRQSIANAEQKSEQLKRNYPEAMGELTSPPVQDWRRRLDETAAELTELSVAKTRGQYNEISHDVEGLLNSYAEYETFDSAVEPIERKIGKIKADEITAGRTKAEEAAKLVESAKEARNQGKRGISEILGKAEHAVQEGLQAISAERVRLEQEAARKKIVRRTILATTAIVSLCFIGLLIWLNRRRVPAMRRAKEALADREKQVETVMEKVYELFDRSGEILGDKEKVRRRGYEGTTKKLTGNAFEDVDDLFVMSTEVERVMDEAREMIRPQGVTGKIANMVSASKYEQGVNRISGEPLKFHRDKGLPLVIQRESERTGEEPPEEVTMTFDKVFDAFRERSSTAEGTLNTIENSLLHVDDNMKKLQQQIETASSLDREFSDAADDDGFFDLPALFEKLIPSAQEDYDEADKIAAVDPVKAVQEQIPTGTRKMVDALTLLDSIKHARTEIFPKLNELAPQLQELEYNTNWIQGRVRHLGEKANGLMETAVKKSVRPEVVQFGEEVIGLGERAQKTVDLARELRHNGMPAIEDLEQMIVAARNEISSSLSLPSEGSLREYEANPDLNLADARKQLAAAQAALQHGGVEPATEAQETLDQQVEAGKKLIDRSLQILHQFDRTLSERQHQLENVQQKVPRHQATLEGLSQEYAASALTLQAADPTYEDPTATVNTHLKAVNDSLQNTSDFLRQAGDEYRVGHLLESDRLLENAEQTTTQADSLLGEIDSHCTRLSLASQENEGKLATMLRELEAMHREASDRRTVQGTVSLYHATVSEVESAQREIQNTTPRDPFEDGRAIENFRENVRNLSARIEADHESHAEAARAVAGAKQERRTAEKLINQAKHDGIPDSPATTQSIREIERQDSEIRQIEQALQSDHNDWKEVDHAAARLHAELGVKTGRLRGELQRAQRLMGVFQSASDSVFEATRWTGGFGTRIFGSPGSKELDRARRALNQGDYSTMAELARTAQLAAQQAIQRAQREVYRRQREQARREEAARRKRRNSMRISSGGISRSSGGGISSRSIGSSRSSGSGFSRSGW